MKELIAHRTFFPAMDRFATKVGFHDGDYHGTFAEHGDRVLRLRHALQHQLGLDADDRFAVLALNSHEYLELYHAAFLGGGIINPLNLRLSPNELQFILADSGTKAVFVDAAFADHFARSVAGAGDRLPLEKVILIGNGHDELPHDLDYDELIAAGEPVIPPEPEEDTAVVVMYTGGTTGVPKGAVLDQRAEALNIYHIGMTLGLSDHRVYLHQTPMFHAASMGGILGIPSSGGTSVFVPIFDPVAVMAAIEQYRVDWTVMVPTMIAMVLNEPSFVPKKLSSLKDLVYGASPMPLALLSRLQETLPETELWQGYGMTECSSVLTILTDEDHHTGGAKLASAGRPLTGVEISVQDEDGNILKPGQDGEICAKGGNFMQCYWNRAEETAAAFRAGWYHTGDAGHVDQEGYVYLMDRVKDMIVSGGENIYSIEVENAISTHPAVAEVAVIGIPSEIWGEQVHAIVVLHPGATATAEELIAHARMSIAGYKVPKSVEFRSEPLPLSGALKPLKRDLRRPYWENAAR